MVDARYALVWPRELFDWEARRVVQLPDEVILDAIGHLLREAFQDSAVLDTYTHESGANAGPWASEAEYDRARAWLRSLLANESKLMPYVPPRYFAQREGHSSFSEAEPIKLLALAFAELLLELQDLGYFPESLPRDCVDNRTSWEYVSSRAARAIHLPFDWDGEARDALTWDESSLYSLIEYFHDGAQRPRTMGFFHDYGGCGNHYAEHSAESGGVVYRWRVNTLLETYGVELRLGTRGDERGRLTRHFGTALDAAANSRVTAGVDNAEDEVAHAIRMFRERGATVIQRRQSLALLAGALEARRKDAKLVLGKDESDLFNIANNFGIRHRNDQQRVAYGDEFLDYMFATMLAAVTLLEELEQRAGNLSS